MQILLQEVNTLKEKGIYPVLFPESPDGKQIKEPIVTDPFGSYTGIPVEFPDLPVQDVDDL